jgi:DNA modification methylase/rubredoxin
MADQSSLNLSAQPAGPVECLGRTFPSEDARQEHYLNLLAAKLKEPTFRKTEGFPVGTDDAILSLSDPPYYTACPNPWIGDFIKFYGTPYDPKKPYHREPFAADVSEGKNHPIYNAHSYHTKVPHRAIMRYILHYTEPGQVVFDGFCGTGMTGVAAQLCGDRSEVQALGYRVLENGDILNEEGKAFTKLGARRAILNDLSPAATSIANGLTNSIDYELCMSSARRVVKSVEKRFPGIYATSHNGWSVRDRKHTPHKAYPRGDIKGDVEFTLYSDVVTCPQCEATHTFYEIGVDAKKDELRQEMNCPSCKAHLSEGDWTPVIESYFDPIIKEAAKRTKIIPVLINYSVGTTRFEKLPDDDDLTKIRAFEENASKTGFAKIEMIPGKETLRNVPIGIKYLHQFFTPLEHAFAAGLLDEIRSEKNPSLRSFLQMAFTAMLPYTSRMRRFRADRKGGGPLSGTLYVSSLITPLNAGETFLRNAQSIASGVAEPERSRNQRCITTQSATAIADQPTASLDYIFVDPPFGFNFDYSELNFFWEGFLRVRTAQDTEAIISSSQDKSLGDYAALMRSAFAECFRILKPGRWMTVEFSNTQASVWNAIQSSLQEVGFVVANVSALDKKQMSFKAVTTTTAVKQDLVISAYKPNGGLEERFAKTGSTVAGVWDFIRTHLRNLPVVKAKGGQLEVIAERDPRILYDRMVAFYVGHSMPVLLSSAEFQAELETHFVERDGMWFMPEQVNEYDKKRAQMENVGQLAIFVEDERSAIDWLRIELKEKPQTTQDIQPGFMQQLSASWKKWEARPELKALLDQNFLCYDGSGEVPSQIHSYLSTQFKELRNLAKDHAQLRQKGKDRWYVPDPKKSVDVETVRNKRLLEEFWSYLPDGYLSAARSPDRNPTLPMPGLASPRPKVPRSKKLKQVRTEAVRVGFKYCYQQKDYPTILAVADMLPESVLNEDEQLQMIYDNAALRAEATS